VKPGENFYMKNFSLSVFALLVFTAVSGQHGSPLLTHFAQSREIENQSWAICQDENKVMLFANRRGISSFDGQDWLITRIPVIPYSMQRSPETGKIFIGSDNNFGYVEKDKTGCFNYVSISDSSIQTGIITRILFADKFAWFYSDQSILRFNLITNKTDLQLIAKNGFPFSGMFHTSKNTFINVLNQGLYRLESDTLFPIVTGYLTENVSILFCLPYNDSRVLLGLSNGRLSLFDGIKYYDYVVRDEGYLEANYLSEGIALGDTAYAFSTLEGGAIVVEKNSGKVLFTVNNQNELPDDEVFAMGSDNTGGLWLSHQYGLTRADLNLPVENFSIFPGLKGNLSSSLRHNNELYVATSEGVFYLAEVKDYTEVEILIKKEQSQSKGDDSKQGRLQDEQAGRKNIFTRIFGKKPVQQKAPESLSPESKPAVQYTRKTVSRLKSINFVYRKVAGFNEKCRQMVSTPYGILAATNRGLYYIHDKKASPVSADRYINFITWEPVGDKYYIGTSDGFFTIKYINGNWITDNPLPGFTEPIYSIAPVNSDIYWLGGDDAAYKVNPAAGSSFPEFKKYSLANDFPQRFDLSIIDDSVFLVTDMGIHCFNSNADKFIPYRNYLTGTQGSDNMLLPLSNKPVVRLNHRWISPGSSDDLIDNELSLLKIFDDIVSINVENNYIWIVDGNNRLFSIDRNRSSGITPSIDVFIKSITNERGIAFNLEDVKFDRGDKVIRFSIVAPGYLKQNTTQYQYIISKFMDEWSPWSVETSYEKDISKPGDYTLQVRAMDLWGNIGKPQSVKFTIKAPFTQTLFFYFLSGILILSFVIFIFRWREKQLQTKNRILEEKVKERTAEIEAQKEEITSSIEYASRIQRAMLPTEEHFRDSFSDHFIFFRPRDIVSGDFYWIGENDRSIFITVSDCTGHGVPGAFMSTMGISTLNEIIANNDDLQANTVLNLLREKTITALHQTGKEGEAADGMDISFCVLNKNRKILQYSGAYNPLLIFQNGELKEYKADRMPIGIHYGVELSFTNYVINVTRGDTLYIFSDGFNDQFGGPEGSKYKKSNLKKLLSDIYYRPMVEQRNILETEFDKWKGSLDQIDDITIIGIRI
jgi:serine phosphatase RsbU (regulator of sigma subunit)